MTATWDPPTGAPVDPLAAPRRGASVRRILELLGWLAVGVVGLVMLTQAVGWDGGRLVASVQSITPYLVLVVAAITGLASARAAHGLAVTGAFVGLGGLVLALPLVVTPGQPAPIDDAIGVRVGTVNLLYSNRRTSEVATELARHDLDLVVFSEYTAEHQAALLGHPLADRFPHRVDRDGLAAGGMAVWSRFPIVERERIATVNYSVDAVVAGPDGDVRVVAVHPPTPIFDHAGWTKDLRLIGDVAHDDGLPTLVVGDFNASYWHPVFRDLLDTGLVDAHMANGRGWSTSWPTDEFVPPFVRLDHALTDESLVSTDVDDFRVPGSDHTGFVVTVAPAR